MNKEIQVGFVNTDQMPLTKDFVCYFARADGEDISLFEVAKVTYPHPDAPNDALIFVIETNRVKTFQRNSSKAAALELLKHAEENAANVYHLL